LCPRLIRDVHSKVVPMTTFKILPVDLDLKTHWVVKTTHDNGKIDTSIAYSTRDKAQTAADGWKHLDEDWAKV
jgi:hypothetical protein